MVFDFAEEDESMGKRRISAHTGLALLLWNLRRWFCAFRSSLSARRKVTGNLERPAILASQEFSLSSLFLDGAFNETADIALDAIYAGVSAEGFSRKLVIFYFSVASGTGTFRSWLCYWRRSRPLGGRSSGLRGLGDGRRRFMTNSSYLERRR